MSNSSTSPVHYPFPYSAVGGCPYMEKANKNGTTTKKLCNFLPYLKCDINVDDGVEQTRTFRIAGIHESGRLLPEIEVTVKEFGKMDWVLERWGAECVIEPGNSNRENICCAILKTAGNAEKKNVYRTTGWQLIDGKWEYLLPNDGKHDVRLFGKLRHYEMATHWSDSDLKTVWSMMKDRLIATKAIIWTLIAFVFLTPLNEFFRQVFYEPKFVLCLIGKTGSRKSTLAALFLSFFGRFSGTDLPLSFSDTLNSILTNINTLKDVLTCIDDFHPGTRSAEKRDTNIAQGIDRAFGDRIGKGRLTSDCTPMEARPPQGNAIVTGETVPDVGESGTARTFTLEIKRGDVDLKNLSFFQSEAKNGTLMSCLLSYTEWIKGIYLHNESAQEILLEDLSKSFEAYRDEFIKTDSHSHGRVAEMVAWLTIGMKYFGKNRSARVILKDSFRQFIDVFTYAVYLKDLHVFTCKHCGAKYLAVADMDYCNAPECLEERKKAKRRTKRQNRKYDPFVHPMDNFHDYARGRRRDMTLAGATKEELAAFKELHKNHADYIRGSLDSFRNKGILPDDEFFQICSSYKKELKARADYVIKQKRNKA